MSRAKHYFGFAPTDLSYESSMKSNGHSWDKALDKFTIRFTCIKCKIQVKLERPGHLFNLAASSGYNKVPGPTAKELINTPNCAKWRMIQQVMES